jgi:hypothetical protein
MVSRLRCCLILWKLQRVILVPILQQFLQRYLTTFQSQIKLVSTYADSAGVLTIAQILSITCDNASNNNTMVEELKDLLEIFPGESNRTWCFNHIVNLIVKSVIQQFDIPKAKGNESFDDVLWELMVSAEDLDKEELATREGECCV